MSSRACLAVVTVAAGALAVAAPAGAGTFMSSDVPKSIPECIGSPGACTPAQTGSYLTVPAGYGTITDVDVVGLKLSHTRTHDLELKLMSPLGTDVMLMERECADENLLAADTLVFDQDR